ncbi:P10 [Pseudomonas phage phi8]|uniref:p10 n=1 Tax=Pseudomonas phage phi8 TaxID=120086 RepID=Q9MC12_9VIRU|nr:membrane protein [Pseudomonas phage phi8]AAF63303.1 P10 [Pseudomonas phage phi8]
MGGIAKSLKRVLTIVLVVVAIVFVVMVALAFLAPALFGTLTGATLTATTIGGAISAASTAVGAMIMSTEALMLMGGLLFSTYMSDKQAAEMQANIAEETEAAKGEVGDHFSQMENDRYNGYEGPSLGVIYDRDTEKEIEKEVGGSTSESRSSAGLFGLFILGGAVLAIGAS